MKKLIEYKSLTRFFKKQKKGTILYVIIGFIAVSWFLIRVIPKPQRAMYPCQRILFPFISSFVIWILGIFSSLYIFKNSQRAFRHNKWIVGIVLLIGSIVSFYFASNPGGTKTFAMSIIKSPIEEIIFATPLSQIMNPISEVSIIESGKDNVNDIQQTEVDSMVRKAVELVGGLENLIHDGQNVVIKPNLLTSHSLQYDNRPDTDIGPGSNGIVTDYRIIQSTVNIVRELNPNGRIILIEGSGVGTTRENFTKLGWDQVTGLDQVIFLDEICEWQDYNSDAIVKVSIPQEKVLYTSGTEHNAYYMSKDYYEADVLISLPCLKNHGATGITGAIKNVGIGATPPPIYGWGENNPNIANERWNPDNGVNHGTELNRDPLHNWIHDFYLAKPVDFVIMDGLQGIENGPGAHYRALSSNQENMRLILASNDPVSIDAIESLIVGQDPAKIKYLCDLYTHGAGNLDTRLINIYGKEVHEVKKKFRIFGSGNFTKYNDFSAPEVNIHSVSFIDNNLSFSLSSNENISKVEISVNGLKEEGIIIEEFDNINYPLSQIPGSISDIVISVFDKYLNCTKLQLINTGINMDKIRPGVLKIFPNPVENSINIIFNEEILGSGKIEITDLMGRLVKTVEVLPGIGSVCVYLNDLKPGIYIIRLNNKNSNYQNKFVKL